MFDVNHIKKTYLKMAIPVVIGLIITLIYNLADAFFVSTTQNDALMAGVSFCGPLFTLLMAFGNLFGQGCSSVISRLLGKQDYKDIKKVSSFAFYGALFTGILVMALMLICQNPILKLLGASGDNLEYARQYYIWLSIGAPGIICSFIHGNLIRCEGYAKEAMIGHLVGSILNILLDPLFIMVFKWGAMGAAVATIIGYYVSTLIFIFYAWKKSKYISLKITDMVAPKALVLSSLGIGITVAITNIMQTVSNIVLNNYLKPYGGDPTVNAMNFALKVTLISQLLLSGFSFGAVPVFGYLFGSNNKEKIKELTRFCVLFLGGIALFLTIMLGSFAPQIMSVFFKDKDTILQSATMLRWQSVGVIFMTMILLVTVLFQASGKALPALIMSISRQGVIFIVVLIICQATMGYYGVVITQALADIISCVIGFVLYIICFKKKEIVINESTVLTE